MKEFSQLCGLNSSTIRYYEKLGLIVPERDINGYRNFSKRDLDWINFIIRLKQIGMAVKDIQRYAALREIGQSTILDRIDMLAIQESRLTEKIEELKENMLFLEKKKKIYIDMMNKSN
ncbi:putative mercuric resistance operon regulatory protein [Enterococcus faecalis 02-MB-P-10]|nr:putative mercuric resistance operon regulatory protein [Enterococcus faecalis 02-MB-P-10]